MTTPEAVLAEPRLKPLFDIYCETCALRERMMHAVMANPAAFSEYYAALSRQVGELAQAAARLMIAVAAMQKGEIPGYETFCEELEKWGQQ